MKQKVFRHQGMGWRKELYPMQCSAGLAAGLRFGTWEGWRAFERWEKSTRSIMSSTGMDP